MKYSCVIIASLLAIVSAYPSGAPEGGESVTQSPSFSDLIIQAQESITNLGKDLQEKLNLPNQETVVEAIKSQSSDFVTNIQNYIQKVSEDVKAKSPEFEKTWEDIKGKLNQAVTDINAQIPVAQEQAKELQAKLTQGLNVLVEESSKAAQAINQNSEKVREDVAKITKQAVNIAVETTRNLDNQLRQMAVTEAPK